jgi:arylsulfatase A-like enzyme
MNYSNLSLSAFFLIPFTGLTAYSSDVASGSNRNSTPNVILIVADDMGFGDLSCCGQKILKTPHIDRMAGEGIFFNNMYTGSSVCAPSRASLMTGMHTGHCSVRGNAPDQIVNDSEMTLAKIFKQAGYVTGAVGKWGLGTIMPYDDPQRKGFDTFYGYINMWHAHNFYPEFLIENGKRVELSNKNPRVNGVDPYADKGREGKGVAEVRNEYAPFLFDAKAATFIEQNKNQKFFLYLAYNTPHANNEGKQNGMEVPDYYEFANTTWPEPEKGFAAMMRNLDNSVGKILAKLKELKIDKNTLVLFITDNGPHQEGGHHVDFFDSNGKYRGWKRDFYEGGIKSPCIARWPGTIKAGSITDQVFAFWDFLPTFAEFSGVKDLPGTDGISFYPTLLGKPQTERHDYLYWEFYEKGGTQTIIKDQWKAIKLKVSGPPAAIKFELYDIVIDPEELTDVAAQHPELVKQFEVMFKDSRTEFAAAPLFNVTSNPK